MKTAWMLSSLAWVPALCAQEAAEPPTHKEADTQPAIVLLLRGPLELDASIWRRQWSEVAFTEVGDAARENDPWLKAEGDTLIGGRDGVQFVVRSVKEPRKLADWQVRHLTEDERAELRTHRAAVEVMFVGKPPVGEPRHDAYRVLASIAAALPKEVPYIGIGMADHGTFDVESRPRMLSRLKDPLDAMLPRSVLRLFAAKASTFDNTVLAARLSKEFGTEFVAGKEGTNSVNGAGGSYASVDMGDLHVSLHWSEKYELSKQQIGSYADPQVRRLLTEHQAVLEISTSGPAGIAAETARHRVLARIAALLWNDDVLGLNWRCSRSVVAASSATPELLRREDPLGATIGKPAANPSTGR
jgi:hypothetical protein